MFEKASSLLVKLQRYMKYLRDLYLLNTLGFFDSNWYLSNNPDVAQSKTNPQLHYLRWGGLEGRDPGPSFSSTWYLDAYEDVRKEGINPLVHYLLFGQKEGRAIRPSELALCNNDAVAVPVIPHLYFEDDAERVFCVSMQRTGTTSVGKFFRDFGFKWAGWPADEKNNWSSAWYDGDFERIFSSPDFRSSNAFEDSPWFLPDFYKILFHRFPNSKFILLIRDPDAWFQSMLNHSGGSIIGRARMHCKTYRRELEYFELLHKGFIDEHLENNLYSTEKKIKITGLADHYKGIYRLHNIEVQDFFQRYDQNSLFVVRLEDPFKWIKLGKYLSLNVPVDYESCENVSFK